MTATMSTDPLAELVDKAVAEIHAALQMPRFEACRAILADVGIRRCRMALVEAPEAIAAAQALYRTAQAAQAAAKEAHAQAVAEAEWTLDGRFVVEGNKTFLVTLCEVCDGQGFVSVRPDSSDWAACDTCKGEKTVRKSLTAPERQAWKDREARNVPAVQAAARALAVADEDVAAARDAIEVAKARLTATKHALDAAVAEVNVLALGLRAEAVAP